MYVIGITGALGSGKSLVAKLLSEYISAPIIDVAKITRQIVEPGQPVLQELVDTFGEKNILTNGVIDQKKINKILFNEYKYINAIISPTILKETENQINEYRLLDTKYVIYDTPCLFNDKHEFVNYTVAVYIPQELQIKRIQKRGTLSDEEIKNYLTILPPFDTVLKYPFDFLIRNTVNFNNLRGIVMTLWRDIQEKLK